MNIDQLSRRIVLGIGLIALVLGVAAIAIVEPLVGVLPSNAAVVAAAGALAFLLGLWGIRTRYRARVNQTIIPDVEFPLPTPAPGHEIDDALYRLTVLRQGTTEIRNNLQERLGEIAVTVIRQRENCTREEAVQQLQDGTWTDNEYAAGFFGGGTAPTKSLAEKVFGSNETVYERWIKTTVDAIAKRAELTPEEESAPVDEAGGGFLDRLGFGSGGSTISRPIKPGYRTRSSAEDAEEVADGVRYAELVPTGQWTGITAFALLAAGWGLAAFNPGLLLVSVIGIGFSAYARSGTAPDLRHLKVERTFDEENPDPGEVVEVTVRVTNESGTFIPDLRLIDQIPGSFRVVAGSPRLGTTLSAGDTATFSYDVVVQRGMHEWTLLAVGRDISGSIEREASIEADDDEELQVIPSLRTTAEMPVRSQTSLFSGQVDTDIGGSGLEFYAVREYRESDPMNRIDWKRHARTGELATIDFRLERAAQVVLLFDARDSAFLSPRPTAHHALDRSVQAASEVFGSLFDEGDLVGVAAFDTVPCWLGPGAGDGHRERARRLFATHPALSSTPPKLSDVDGHYVDPMTHVRRQLSPDAQIMLFSPLCDDYTSEVARRLNSAGHPVTIISADPTADRTIGQRLAQIEREMRIATLRERGIRVIDWKYDQMLGLNLDHARKRWAV